MSKFNLPTIDPEAISLITTYKCTAACNGCCFNCTPHKSESMSLAKMKELIDEVCLDFPAIKLGILTGGECFTLGEDLYTIIQYMHDKGLHTRIVTNGYWATSIEKANRILSRLKSIGLDEINFSTGDCHQQWVSIDCVINGVIAAITNECVVAVNIETHRNSNIFTAEQFRHSNRLEPYLDSPLLTIISSIWIPPTSENNNAEKHDECIVTTLQPKRCKQLFNVITISPNYELFCCCGLTIQKHQYLNLGKITAGNIREMWERQFQDFIKIWLFTEGPDKIIEYAKQKNKNICLHTNNQMHLCEKCMKLISNKDIIQTLSQNYKGVVSRVLLEYNIYKQTKKSSGL